MTHPALHRVRRLAPGLVLAVLLWGGCDTVVPEDDNLLVIEAYFESGQPLPAIAVQQGTPLSLPLDARDAYRVSDAELTLDLDGRTVPYRPVPGEPGRYLPAVDDAGTVDAYTRFALTAAWRHIHATASGDIPPAIRLDSIRVVAPDVPVDAILVDSLRLDTLGLGAQKGFIYPVEVTLWWQGESDAAFWIETQLRPRITFSSAVIDFFLQPLAIGKERDMDQPDAGTRSWQGLYGIPVDAIDAPLPDHALTVMLIRSYEDYARFASTRNQPQRREPRTNLDGAAGIVAGIAIDSLSVDVSGPLTRAARTIESRNPPAH